MEQRLQDIAAEASDILEQRLQDICTTAHALGHTRVERLGDMVEQRLKYIVEHIIQAQKCRLWHMCTGEEAEEQTGAEASRHWCRGPAPTYVKTRRSTVERDSTYIEQSA